MSIVTLQTDGKKKKERLELTEENQEPAGGKKKTWNDPWENIGKINRFNCPGLGGMSLEKQTRLR